MVGYYRTFLRDELAHDGVNAGRARAIDVLGTATCTRGRYTALHFFDELEFYNGSNDVHVSQTAYWMNSSMALEKAVLNQLQKFAAAFRDARERGANESDTVMFLVKFFEDVLGYDPLKGEIS